MRNLIVSDILRILKKKTYWIIFLIVLIGSLTRKFNNDDSFSSMTSQLLYIQNFGSVLLGINIFISVYADEFSSRSMQCIIGRGLSRAKLQTAKFCNCIIITFISYTIWSAWMFLLNLIFGSNMEPIEKKALYLAFFIAALQAIGYSTISAIILYKSSNIAFATVIDILLYLILYVFIDMIVSAAPLAPFLAIQRNSFTGLTKHIYTNIILGQSCVGMLIGAIVFYIGGSLLLSILVFRKRELEF